MNFGNGGTSPDELTFAPLGGVGEIGMNLSIYGLNNNSLGNKGQRSWLAVDLGVSFGNEEHLPGIDVIMPDIAFWRRNARIWSASFSPTPTRIISARSSICGRVCAADLRDQI